MNCYMLIHTTNFLWQLHNKGDQFIAYFIFLKQEYASVKNKYRSMNDGPKLLQLIAWVNDFFFFPKNMKFLVLALNFLIQDLQYLLIFNCINFHQSILFLFLENTNCSNITTIFSCWHYFDNSHIMLFGICL